MNKAEPTVSVLMTSYNRERYIGAAIESVLSSSFADFELIISDDRSSDNTVEISNSYARKDSRVKVFVNDNNVGDYKNRNLAASRACGKYLKYVDADDLIYPRGLEIMVEMMERFPDAGWGLCSLEQDENNIFPFVLSKDEIYRYAYLGPGLFHKAPLSSIIKRECFSAIGGFSGKQHLGDFELWHLLSIKYPIVLMPHGIVWHRIHDEQESVSNRTDPLIGFKYLVSALRFFKECNFIPINLSLKKQICWIIRRQMFLSITKYIMRFKFFTSFKLIMAIRDKKYTFLWEHLND